MRTAQRSLTAWLACSVLAVSALSTGCSDAGGGKAGPGSGGAPSGSGGSGGATDAGGPNDLSSAGSGGAGGVAGGSGGSGGGSGGGAPPDANAGDVPRPVTDGPPSMAWTGTWGSSPQGCGGNFAGRTLRQIVHTSMAGTSARIRLSNTFSAGPLTVRDVHIAQRTTGSSIDVATSKALLFGGQPEVTIPARMFAESDGAEFAVKALSDVAISFFVVSNNGATCHSAAWQTNYSAAGNVVSSATLTAPQNSNSWTFLSNVDVLNPAAEGAVVTLGASITDGFYAPANTNQRWPDFLAARLVAANRAIGVLNHGISADGVMGAVNRFDRDVLSQPNVKWVIFSDNPINDFGRSRPSAEAELTLIKGMIAKAHAKGVKFLCSTMTPYAGAEPGRTQLNALLRNPESGCDGIVPMDTATSDPAAPMRWNPAHNSGDGLHPNAAGMQAMAGAVDLALFK